MVVTSERINPDLSHPIAEKYYGSHEKLPGPMFKKFVHVIPRRTPATFRLIDLV